jgi:hypothetical protein
MGGRKKNIRIEDLKKKKEGGNTAKTKQQAKW